MNKGKQVLCLGWKLSNSVVFQAEIFKALSYHAEGIVLQKPVNCLGSAVLTVCGD